MKKGDVLDPKGLIFEAYRIEGISHGECRSIFLDWALSLPMDAEITPLLTALIERHGPQAPDHPMTQVLREGRAAPPKSGRRGGRGARRSGG